MASRSLIVFLPVAIFAGCSGDDDETIAPTYENVEITLSRACAFSTSCHGGAGRGSADLNFATAIESGTVLEVLTVPSCEYSRMPRVDPGNPDGSWIMVKLEGEHDADGNLTFTPDADWTPDSGGHPETLCPLMMGGEVHFGTIMPATAPFDGLPEDEIEMFRQWIEMGAPGPS